MFDIVIPVHKKDLAVLEYCIAAARNKIVGTRRIITVSKERYTNNAEWFAEANFPFDIELARRYTGDSCGWYFQQLLKLYAPFVIPDILPNVLILDSDTVFFRKTKMFDSQNRPFYNISKDKKICRKPFDIAVEEHIQKLYPEISRKNLPDEFQEFSGICHSMMFNKDVLQDLFNRVESCDKEGDKFYKIFLKYANHHHSASEYQIYFNFILIFYKDKIAIRRLKYKNTADLNIKKYQKRLKYSYCSFHSYLRDKKGLGFKDKIINFFKKIYRSLFIIEIWNIGIAKCPISEYINIPNQKIKWFKRVKINKFRADPFGLVINDKKYIFYEKYEFAKRKGKICALELDDNLEIVNHKVILKSNSHFSYPYIFTHKNINYALIESHKDRELALYQILDDISLKKIRVIFKDLPVIDPSLIFFENKFWIFFNLPSKGDPQLHIAYSDDLMGEFKMHKKNPVKTDIFSARSGGQIFMHNGIIYRPGQNCQLSYGGSLRLNRIITLNEKEFLETEEIQIMPNQLDLYPEGLHTLSTLGDNLTLIDGKRKIFIWYKPLIYLGRLLKRVLIKKISKKA